jgi:hypothetical protein
MTPRSHFVQPLRLCLLDPARCDGDGLPTQLQRGHTNAAFPLCAVRVRQTAKACLNALLQDNVEQAKALQLTVDDLIQLRNKIGGTFLWTAQCGSHSHLSFMSEMAHFWCAKSRHGLMETGYQHSRDVATQMLRSLFDVATQLLRSLIALRRVRQTAKVCLDALLQDNVERVKVLQLTVDDLIRLHNEFGGTFLWTTQCGSHSHLSFMSQMAHYWCAKSSNNNGWQ